MNLPERKSLPHEIPWWVAQGARHFISVNALERGGQPFMALLERAARSESVALPRSDGTCEGRSISARSETVALPRSDGACEAGRATFSERADLSAATAHVTLPLAQLLLDSLIYYDTIGRWYLWTAVVMPDHLHFIATFNLETGLESALIAWKRYQAKTLGIEFQRDYFEHRLRNDEEFVEKTEYIRENPVRKGLVDTSEAWPYFWHR